MKRLIPILATVALGLALPLGALAKEKEEGKRRSKKRQTVEQRVVPSDAFRPATGPVTTTTVTGPSNDVTSATTASGADTVGVARSTGAGIGESSTRSDVGTGRGGAGITSTGSLAPSAARPNATVTTTVPATTTTSATAGTVISPAIPRNTTNTGTLGSGTSTPAGVAPGR